jgi:hypothetical protein
MASQRAVPVRAGTKYFTENKERSFGTSRDVLRSLSPTRRRGASFPVRCLTSPSPTHSTVMSDSEGDFSDELLELAGATEKKRRKRQERSGGGKSKRRRPE